jgi:hypothetical protein
LPFSAVSLVVFVPVPAKFTFTPGVIVKFAFEMSKKMFPTASTLILACVVLTLGSVTTSEPSLSVLSTSTVEKEFPPFVESRIRTFAQLTGVRFVDATFHVTVVVPLNDPAAFGAVTVNGPAVPFTVITTLSTAVPPFPDALSRATTRYCIVLATCGRISPNAVVFASRFESRGNVRDGLDVGSHVRWIGFVPLSVPTATEAVPVFRCSHEYVIALPSESDPVAVSTNGVCFGIV